MRSLKHLKHHARNNVVKDDRPLERCHSKLMDQQVEVGTQTDPVVVLSLAQAAVLGLISQNEVFRATIAPNGFYVGEAMEPSPTLASEVEYQCTDQLIGANGDYLNESIGQAHCKERRRTGPRGRWKKSRSEGEASQDKVGGDGIWCTSLSCVHRLMYKEGLRHVGPSTYRVSHKKEQSMCREKENCEQIERKSQQAPCQDRGEEEEQEKEKLNEGDEEGKGEGGSPMKSHEKGGNPVVSQYFESSQIFYESAELGTTREADDHSQTSIWPEPMGSDGQTGRRMQIDRLDINVQIDESYCVDVGEGLKRWKCRMCEKSYTSKYNLVTHILGHNGIKPHKCQHCGKLFKQPSHLQTHLLTHQGMRPHKCSVCKKAFTQTSHLKRHMLQHTDVKPYSCRFCDRGFAYPSELRAHETKYESGHCHVCAQCGMEFPTHAHLKRHQSSHQGPNTYQCLECNRSFAYRSQLQNHLMKHQNIRPFVCTECGMEFVQVHHFKQHVLTHKKTKGFKCDVCSRDFTLSANLKRHMLIHASVRPYQCHICFKTFVQKQTLKTHMIVHLPTKPFKCKVCGKSFNRMYNLLGHMHLHAGSKPFQCPYCSSKFNLKGNLSRHMKVKHGLMDTSPDGRDTLPEKNGQENYEENFHFT